MESLSWEAEGWLWLFEGLYEGDVTWESQCISSGSNLALLDKSEPCGHSSVLNLSNAHLTAERVYAHGSLSTSLVL